MGENPTVDIRIVTGYLAHALLAGYWLWVISCTAPQLRMANRVLLVKTAGVALSALVVGVVHFWATQLWHVVVAVPVAVASGLWLRRRYQRLVATPRHRISLRKRVRRADYLRFVPHPPGPAVAAAPGRAPHREPRAHSSPLPRRATQRSARPQDALRLRPAPVDVTGPEVANRFDDRPCAVSD